MNINEITDSNLKAHARLYSEVFNGDPWNENWSIASAFERLSCYRNTPNFIGIEAIDNDELIGLIFGNAEPYQSTDVYILKEMCVSKKSQRQGIGKALLETLHALLVARKITKVDLLTRVDSNAESFYFNQGYSKISRIGLYVKDLST